ncbi:MAG: hypothetical protein KN64_03780 [Sulfurovum sp. AS07-7]|nr:MAG: hypothetical protein KN64_03780 [Sulfurovum sp. AS07-7]
MFPNKKTTWVFWLVGILFFFIIIGLFSDSSEQESNATINDNKSIANETKYTEEETLSSVSLETFSAKDLAKAYDENTVFADQKFKDKQFKVNGIISDISTDIMGNPYLTLKGGVNEFMEPQFQFDKSEINQLASLKKGKNITLICTGKGDIAKTPMSGDCSLAN